MSDSIKKVNVSTTFNLDNNKGNRKVSNNINGSIKFAVNNDTFTNIDEMSDFDSIMVQDVIKSQWNYTDLFGNNWVYMKNKDGIDIVMVNEKPLDIFGDYNLSTFQFGGSQMDLAKSVIPGPNGSYIFTDEYIYNTLKKYFPGASDYDYYYFLQVMQNYTCQYTALINSLYKQYEGREEEFYKIFGFPMYEVTPSGEIDYNYEKLIVEYCCYVEAKLGLQVKDISIVPTKVESGTSYAQQQFSEFLSQYNIDVDTGNNKYLINISRNTNNASNILTALNPFSDLNESFKIAYLASEQDPNSHMIVSVNHFNLYTVDNNQKGKLTDENVLGHAMYVTGITDDGYLKVSSWGNEYVLDLSELPISMDTFCFYQTIHY